MIGRSSVCDGSFYPKRNTDTVLNSCNCRIAAIREQLTISGNNLRQRPLVRRGNGRLHLSCRFSVRRFVFQELSLVSQAPSSASLNIVSPSVMSHFLLLIRKDGSSGLLLCEMIDLYYFNIIILFVNILSIPLLYQKNQLH